MLIYVISMVICYNGDTRSLCLLDRQVLSITQNNLLIEFFSTWNIPTTMVLISLGSHQLPFFSYSLSFRLRRHFMIKHLNTFFTQNHFYIYYMIKYTPLSFHIIIFYFQVCSIFANTWLLLSYIAPPPPQLCYKQLNSFNISWL